MKELIKIELKKISMKSQFRSLIIANLMIFFLLLLLFYFEGHDILHIGNYSFVDQIIKAVFLIWQSILIATLVVDEFKNKTIQQLYTYPIKRSRMMSAKLILIIGLMLAFAFITQLVQHSLFYGVSQLLPTVENLAYPIRLLTIGEIILTTPLAIMYGMIPLTVGLWMKSTIAPIITAFLMTSLVGGVGVEAGMDMLSNLLAMSIIGMVSFAFVIISIKDITKKDLVV